MNDQTKFLPCAHCGSNVIFKEAVNLFKNDIDIHRIVCSNCGIGTSIEPDDIPTEKWNRRS